MAYENQPAPQSIQVEVMEVLPQEGAVVIQGPNGLEGKYNVIAPANMSYARTGKATIKFTGEDISYLRNISDRQGFGGGYRRSTFAWGKRPIYQRVPQENNYQANPIVQEQPIAVRQVLLFVEDKTGKQISEIYNKINSVAKIKATVKTLRPLVETEKVEEGNEKKEIIHLKYDADIYIDLPNSVPFASLLKLEDNQIDKIEELPNY